MMGARGLGVGGSWLGLRVWAGQSGVLAPWGCDCDCSPWAPNGHLTSTCGVGVKLVLNFSKFFAFLPCTL